MKINLDLKFFIPAILSLIIAYMTVNGTIDNYITFAGELNAMGFFIMSALMGIMLLIGSVSKSK
jgi:hypothetical protein|tara:strand:+ start:978 stop:1169 length:192 start_codon:yes stop_codon:yes gene_type:complete